MRRNGFTLVELLIVIALVGVIAALAVPDFEEVSKGKDASQCKPNLQYLEIALETYYSEKGTWPSSLTDLRTAGYIKEVPSCSGTYKFIFDIENTGTNTGWYYFGGHVNDANYRTDDAYLRGVPFCTVHGTLKEFHENGFEPDTETEEDEDTGDDDTGGGLF